ncbi:MAG: DUF5691 domain-containing protein [Acidobacteriota bacterium]
MSLAELAKSVLLGTERSLSAGLETPASAPLSQALETLEQRVEESPERKVLTRAAVLAPYEAAGRRSLAWPDHALPAACEPESTPLCSTAAAAVLRRLLDEQKALLPEWLELAAARGVRVPAVLLPRLLSGGRPQGEPLNQLIRAVGRRGLWLAAQNEAWSYLAAGAADELDDNIWQEGRLAERKGYLEALRGRHPEDARRALQEVFGQENATSRAQLLSTLALGLSLDDEPFLESCLDDRSKQVRAVAAQQLAALPGSRLAQRMQQRCGRLVRLKKRLRTTIEIDLPETLDAAMQRDGLSDRADGRGGLGRGAWHLMQLIAATPTTFWTAELQLAPATLLKALRRHAWRAAVVRGLCLATVRERQAELALALLEDKLGIGELLTQSRLTEEDLIRLLPLARRDAFLIARLRRAPAKEVPALLAQLDRATTDKGHRDPWSEALGQAALDRFAKLLRRAEHQQDWRLHSFLSTLAQRLPVSLASAATTEVRRPAKPIPSLEDKLNDFAIVLDLRTQMHKELAP